MVIDLAGTKLAAIHDGSGWKPLALDAQGKAQPAIAGPTLVAAVCDDPSIDFMNYYTVAVGPGGGEVDMHCSEAKPASRLMVTSLSASTMVYVGFASTRGTDDALVVANGTYDIVAVDTGLTPPRIEVRRAVEVTGPMALTFDLAATGTPMQKVDVAVSNVSPTDTGLTRRVHFTLGPKETPTLARWLASGADVFAVPASLLRAEDRQVVEGSVFDEAMGSRSASKDLTGKEGAVELALPSYVTSATVTFGAMPSVKWEGDARFDGVYFGIHDADYTELWDIALDPSWAAAGGDLNAITIPDPRAIPGWTPAWELTSTDLEWYLVAQHAKGADQIAATRTGTLE